MKLRPIADSVFPVRRTAPLGSALLAAVVATALLSAGEARAVLLDGPVTCNALGLERVCTPVEKDLLDNFPSPYVVSDTGVGGDPMFTVIANEVGFFDLTFTDFVTGNALNTTGFRLSGLQSDPDLVPGELVVTFLGDWDSIPVTRPFISLDQAELEWTLMTGADPQGGAIARIGLQFVEPEPEPVPALGGPGLGLLIGAIAVTSALLAAGVNRSRRKV